MGKSKIEFERLDDGGILLKRSKGKLTYMEAYEKLQEYYEYGVHLVYMNVVEDHPGELYDDGEAWEIYAADEWEGKAAARKAYDSGFDDGMNYVREAVQAEARNILGDIRDPEARANIKAKLDRLYACI